MRRLGKPIIAFVLAIAAVAGASTLRAETYPNRPVRVIVGFGPGAVADILARAVANRMGQMLGQQFVIENRTGAGSSLAAEYVARAPKDGHTLFMATVANSINPALGPLSFDFGKDFAPVTLVANVPQMLVAHPSLGVSNVRDLIALAKSKPEQVQYASSGVGTLSHLSAELLNSTAGIKLVQVPYPGSAQGLTDVIAGRVALMFGPASTLWPSVEAGKLKALAVTQTKRASLAPDVPTLAESGVPGFSAGIWMGLLAPAGTPADVVDRLSAAANEALKADEVAKLMKAQGIDALGGSPAEFRTFVEHELKQWADVVQTAGIAKKR